MRIIAPEGFQGTITMDRKTFNQKFRTGPPLERPERPLEASPASAPTLTPSDVDEAREGADTALVDTLDLMSEEELRAAAKEAGIAAHWNKRLEKIKAELRGE
jgi:hypothetical protein